MNLRLTKNKRASSNYRTPSTETSSDHKDAFSYTDKVLEIGKNIGDIAGPLSAPLKGVCTIVQVLLGIAQVRL